MKNSFSFAMTVVGTLIGAGFATGQELFSFFILRGGNSYIYFFISVMMMFLSSLLIYIYARNQNIRNLDNLFYKLFGAWGAFFFTFVITLFLFSCFTVTAAGAGVLFEENMGLPYYYGVLTVIVITFSAIHFNIKGVFFVNSLLTPVIIVCIILFSYLSLYCGKEVFLGMTGSMALPLWYALLYFGYNILSLLPVIISTLEKSRGRSMIKGFIFAFTILLTMGIILLITINSNISGMDDANLPVLDVFKDYSSLCGNIYIIIMYFAMITTAVSCFYGFVKNILSYLNISGNYIAISGLALAFFITGFGFTGLVRKLYSFFGIAGLIIMFCSICKILMCICSDFSKKIIKK